MWNCLPCGIELALEKNTNPLPIQCEIMNRHEDDSPQSKNSYHNPSQHKCALIIQKKWKALYTRRLCAEIRFHHDKLKNLHRLLKEN